MLYTITITISIQQYIYKYRQTLLFRYERFINFWLWFFDTRKETILTMLTILSDPTNTRHIPWCLRSLSVETCKTQLHLQRPRTQLCPNGRNSTVCLHGLISTSNWLFFKILKFLGPSLLGMTSSTLQPHFLSGVYYDNGDCHILCVRV